MFWLFLGSVQVQLLGLFPKGFHSCLFLPHPRLPNPAACTIGSSVGTRRLTELKTSVGAWLRGQAGVGGSCCAHRVIFENGLETVSKGAHITPPPPHPGGCKRPSTPAYTNVPVAGAKAGTLRSCLPGSMHVPTGISGPAGWPQQPPGSQSTQLERREQQQCAQLSRGPGQTSTTSCGCFLQRRPAVCPSCLHLPGTEVLWD